MCVFRTHKVIYKNNKIKMSCVLTSGYNVPCKGAAGISSVYIGSYTNNLTYTLGTSSSLNQIVTFTAGTSSFYTFVQEVEQGSLTEKGNFNPQLGSAFYEQTAEITLTNVTQTLVDQVSSLGKGRWRIIVLDSNGNYWLLGKVNAVSVTDTTGGLGKALGDLNGYTITFTGKEADPLIQVTTAAATSVITA